MFNSAIRRNAIALAKNISSANLIHIYIALTQPNDPNAEWLGYA
ncbi:hypothetical protein AB3R30_14010 [Leptolyngbyaceae cyanobacterium UHCC 1019]